jgi:hypothetical protein
VFAAEGMQVKPVVPVEPNLNASAEGFAQSLSATDRWLRAVHRMSISPSRKAATTRSPMAAVLVMMNFGQSWGIDGTAVTGKMR